MKNKMNLAALIAIGLVAVSCSTDTGENNPSSQKQNYDLSLNTTDSIPKTPTNTFAVDDGIINPKKPN
jgi:hypothetical protein